MIERRIDVSELHHPEPFEIMIRAIGELKEGEYIRMIHRLEPLPLYEVLHKQGFVHVTLPLKGGGYHILIAHSKDQESLDQLSS